MTVEIEHLTLRYAGGKTALDDLCLSIPRGLFGLLGPNGAGKTSLLSLCATRLESGPGSAICPRTSACFPTSRRRASVIAERLEEVGLSQDAHRRLAEFSGGMRQRVGIAQALLGDPDFLIVDEPTSGLDPEERIRFRTLLSQLLTARRERVVILSTHLVGDVSWSDQIGVLNGGRLVFQGTAAELAARAAGQTWVLHARPEDLPALRSTARVTAVQESAPGQVQVRVVGKPLPGAVPAVPSLEDGYVAVVGGEAV